MFAEELRDQPRIKIDAAAGAGADYETDGLAFEIMIALRQGCRRRCQRRKPMQRADTLASWQIASHELSLHVARM